MLLAPRFTAVRLSHIGHTRRQDETTEYFSVFPAPPSGDIADFGKYIVCDSGKDDAVVPQRSSVVDARK
jgi:hypothetical protein